MQFSRVITEIRFQSSFFFEEARVKNDISNMLASDFVHHGYDENQKALYFLNGTHNKKLVVTKGNIVIDIDNPEELSEVVLMGDHYIQKILNKLQVQQTERIGVRSHIISDEIEGVERVSSKIAEQFFNRDLVQFLRNHKTDEQFIPTLSFNAKLNHEIYMTTNVGAHQEASGVADSQGNVKSITINKAHPSLDIDMYMGVPKKPDQVAGAVKGLISHVEDQQNKIWSLGGT
jgi:hypothetical protein